MKDFLKKITGLKKLEDEKARLEKERAEALARAEEAKAKEEEAKKQEELAKLTPKERADALGEPYVSVLSTQVNKDNIRNGFFELDWNDIFILQLKQAGYGFDGDKEEEIVDRWFRDLCRDILAEEGQDINRSSGYINIVPIDKGKSEIS